MTLSSSLIYNDIATMSLKLIDPCRYNDVPVTDLTCSILLLIPGLLNYIFYYYSFRFVYWQFLMQQEYPVNRFGFNICHSKEILQLQTTKLMILKNHSKYWPLQMNHGL